MHSRYDISIIIPVYCNTEESLVWLDECISSAVAQDCYVVIYDDGSPLDVRSIISKYNVDSFSQGVENHGASYARNRCAEQVNTSLILPLDCDDRLKENAVERLYDLWNGTPVYPDVTKFGEEDVPHFRLLDFHCDHLYNHVGFTSVNVLHSKEQWKAIGGWDETIDFYEDGEYNARLLGAYCGIHCREPLVEYRIHSNQRTKSYIKKSAYYAKTIINKIRSYDMACPGCGKKRKTSSTHGGSNMKSSMLPTRGARGAETASVQNVNLPLEFEGRILSQYIGGNGKGRHYYRGIVSRFPYKVMYGDILYADPRDVKDRNNEQNNSLLVKVVRSATPPAPAPAPAPKPVEKKPEVVEEVVSMVPDRTPVKMEVVKTPVVEELPDISKIPAKKVTEMEIDPEVAKKLLKMEKSGLNRVKVVQHLEAIIRNA